MRAYYINLARRGDRRATMEAQFGRLGLAFERIEALTPAVITDAQRARYCDSRAFRWQSEGELACGLSHVLALQRFLASDAPYGLILEDDAILSPALPGFLAEFERLSIQPDLLRIETFGDPQQLSTAPLETMGDYGLHSIHGWAWGAAAYVISRHAARRLCEHPQTLAGVFDRVLYRPNRTHIEPLVRRQLVPALAIQDDRLPGKVWGADSDLKATRNAMQRSMRPGIRQLVADFIENELRIGLPSTIHRLIGRSAKRDVPFRSE